ncbi:hypothetical protein INR49_024807, partial [Caranx melampygus]
SREVVRTASTMMRPPTIPSRMYSRGSTCHDPLPERSMRHKQICRLYPQSELLAVALVIQLNVWIYGDVSPVTPFIWK